MMRKLHNLRKSQRPKASIKKKQNKKTDKASNKEKKDSK